MVDERAMWTGATDKKATGCCRRNQNQGKGRMRGSREEYCDTIVQTFCPSRGKEESKHTYTTTPTTIVEARSPKSPERDALVRRRIPIRHKLRILVHKLLNRLPTRNAHPRMPITTPHPVTICATRTIPMPRSTAAPIYAVLSHAGIGLTCWWSSSASAWRG